MNRKNTSTQPSRGVKPDGHPLLVGLSQPEETNAAGVNPADLGSSSASVRSDETQAARPRPKYVVREGSLEDAFSERSLSTTSSGTQPFEKPWIDLGRKPKRHGRTCPCRRCGAMRFETHNQHPWTTVSKRLNGWAPPTQWDRAPTWGGEAKTWKKLGHPFQTKELWEGWHSWEALLQPYTRCENPDLARQLREGGASCFFLAAACMSTGFKAIPHLAKGPVKPEKAYQMAGKHLDVAAYNVVKECVEVIKAAKHSSGFGICLVPVNDAGEAKPHWLPYYRIKNVDQKYQLPIDWVREVWAKTEKGLYSNMLSEYLEFRCAPSVPQDVPSQPQNVFELLPVQEPTMEEMEIPVARLPQGSIRLRAGRQVRKESGFAIVAEPSPLGGDWEFVPELTQTEIEANRKAFLEPELATWTRAQDHSAAPISWDDSGMPSEWPWGALHQGSLKTGTWQKLINSRFDSPGWERKPVGARLENPMNWGYTLRNFWYGLKTILRKDRPEPDLTRGLQCAIERVDYPETRYTLPITQEENHLVRRSLSSEPEPSGQYGPENTPRVREWIWHATGLEAPPPAGYGSMGPLYHSYWWGSGVDTREGTRGYLPTTSQAKTFSRVWRKMVGWVRGHRPCEAVELREWDKTWPKVSTSTLLYRRIHADGVLGGEDAGGAIPCANVSYLECTGCTYRLVQEDGWIFQEDVLEGRRYEICRLELDKRTLLHWLRHNFLPFQRDCVRRVVRKPEELDLHGVVGPLPNEVSKIRTIHALVKPLLPEAVVGPLQDIRNEHLAEPNPSARGVEDMVRATVELHRRVCKHARRGGMSTQFSHK